MPWYCYIIECGNGFLYTGITKDVARRLKEHQNGKGAKFLKRNKPLRVVWQEGHYSYKSALDREQEIKGWEKERKLQLIKEKRKG